jgi:hypothetical protein
MRRSEVARAAKSMRTFAPNLCNKKAQGIQGCFSLAEVLMADNAT